MAKFSHVVLMLIIAVLFSVFSYSIGTLVMSNPQYQEYCDYDRYNYPRMDPRTAGEEVVCQPIDKSIDPESCSYPDQKIVVYDDEGCPVDEVCDTCNRAYEEAQTQFNLVIFLVMSLLGLVAIVAGLVFRTKNTVTEWITNGFLFGGLISLFIGTVIYFNDAPTLVRPVILLVELAIIIVVALRKMKP